VVKEKKVEEPRPRRGRRSRTPEENLKAIAYKYLEQRAASDPAFQDAIIAHEFGIDINKIDRLANKKQELEVKVVEWAIKEIEDNADLRQVIVRAKAFEIMNMKDPDLEPKPPPPPWPDPVEEMIKRYEKVEKLKEVMGVGKRSFGDQVLEVIGNPAIVSLILVFLGTIFAKQPDGTTPESGSHVNVNFGVQIQELGKTLLDAYSRYVSTPPAAPPTQQSSTPVEIFREEDLSRPSSGSQTAAKPGLATPVEEPPDKHGSQKSKK
jgi:hypothetical protein